MAIERVPEKVPRIRWRKGRTRTARQLEALRKKRAALKAENLAQRVLVRSKRPEEPDILDSLGVSLQKKPPP
ncbi:MAG: hypothetical protein ING91_19430 [Rhodocyclaceae bacterium]|nr:hypothetical protein [Rhodocyclaceae bacterium]MCA3116407.1 hypothetical protein [Rhodocyclaceae bacterium]MCA3129192.1 hypothetical protein [Rhodocyclaceae bacterium]